MDMAAVDGIKQGLFEVYRNAFTKKMEELTGSKPVDRSWASEEMSSGFQIPPRVKAMARPLAMRVLDAVERALSGVVNERVFQLGMKALSRSDFFPGFVRVMGLPPARRGMDVGFVSESLREAFRNQLGASPFEIWNAIEEVVGDEVEATIKEVRALATREAEEEADGIGPPLQDEYLDYDDDDYYYG